MFQYKPILNWEESAARKKGRSNSVGLATSGSGKSSLGNNTSDTPQVRETNITPHSISYRSRQNAVRVTPANWV